MHSTPSAVGAPYWGSWRYPSHTSTAVIQIQRLALIGQYDTYVCGLARSLQKVQGHRTAQGHRAGVDVDVSPPTGGPVGHPPNPATLCDRSAQGSKS